MKKLSPEQKAEKRAKRFNKRREALLQEIQKEREALHKLIRERARAR